MLSEELTGDSVNMVQAPQTSLEMGNIHWFFPGVSCCDRFRGYEPGEDRVTAKSNPDAGGSSIACFQTGLNFVVGAHGLDSLSFNGQSLLVSPENGELQPQKSVFRAVLDALVPRSSPQVATPNENTDTVDLSYPWGRISCAYGKQDDRLTMRLEVSNTSSRAA